MNQLHEIRIGASGMERSFYHRDTAADRGVMHQIFGNQDYSLDRLARKKTLQDFYASVSENKGTPLIVDCGANIGASSVWYSMVYPAASIVAIEPDDENVELLKRNVAGQNVEVLQAAIGCEPGQVHLEDPGLGEWGYRTAASGSGKLVEQISMRQIVVEQMAKGKTPFIAKIDIEGGEQNLFSKSVEWVDFFPLLVIELHDWMLGGQGSARNFLRCIADRDRDFVYIGENIFSIRNF
jgi:FkbM family methyltransferase